MVTRWNPFREMVEMQRTMDRMFDEVNRAAGSNDTNWSAIGKWVSLDVHDNGETYTIHADVPGINPDDINVTIHENTLTISGEITQSESPEGTRQVLNERRFGAFRRSISLPDMVNVDAADASYNNGVLTLTLPKSEQSKPRQISVKANTLLENSN